MGGCFAEGGGLASPKAGDLPELGAPDPFLDGKAPAVAQRTWTLKEQAAYGRSIHNEYGAAWKEEGFVYDQAIPGTRLRPDGLNFDTQVVRELKPRTPSGIKAMMEAQKKYMKVLGPGWTFDPIFYDAPWWAR